MYVQWDPVTKVILIKKSIDFIHLCTHNIELVFRDIHIIEYICFDLVSGNNIKFISG